MLNGDLLDFDRLPVLTVLQALRNASAVTRRGYHGALDLVIFGMWLLLFFRRLMRGALADYVKGNRFHDATALRRMPFLRKVGNAGLSFLIKAASGQWHIFDPTNGYTAIHRAVLEMLDLKRFTRATSSRARS